MSLTITYRNLPHWRFDGAIYFVTWCLSTGQPDLTSEERTLVANALSYFEGERYYLFAWVVMNDHVHLVVWPRGAWTLDSLIHTWKSFTARALQKSGRTGRIWQPETYDRIVRDFEELVEKTTYVTNNPVRRWPDLEAYQWVGAGSGWQVIEEEPVSPEGGMVTTGPDDELRARQSRGHGPPNHQ